MRFYIDWVGDSVGKTGIDVADEQGASIEAVRFAGELLKCNPDAVLDDGIEVSISDADGWVVGVVSTKFHRMVH